MRHILPGRPQSSRQALSTVSWDGLRLVSYISGNTIIVFNGRREILQSIVVDDAEYLSALTIEEESGQIAAADQDTVYVYRPLGRDYGDLRWSRAHTFTSGNESTISFLSWGSPDEILIADKSLTLWSFADEGRPQTIWSSDVSGPLVIACFSPDAGLIASCGQHDRVVKIWRRLSYEQDSTRFDVSYLPHPATVVNVTWRKLWHQEQTLENLLYTFCADHQVRVWAHSDHHAYTTLQKISTIDTSASIQPRRLSMSSVSKSRFSFILGSRDLARAAERALQTQRQGTDHALEHLIEIANRSPEVCVILDGLGHMSSWGIENASLKNKLQSEKFNLALVDGVDIALPSEDTVAEPVQIHAFANTDVSASLCILVHSYTGQIDWYEGSFVEFFDTATRLHRTRHMSCWSGHDSVIDRMVSASNHQSFLSLTEEDQVILWQQSAAGTLVRRSEAQAEAAILDATLLDGTQMVVLLHEDALSLWDFGRAHARAVYRHTIDHAAPKSMQQRLLGHEADAVTEILLLCESNNVQIYRLYLPQSSGVEANGYHKAISKAHELDLSDLGKGNFVELCTRPSFSNVRRSSSCISWSNHGVFRTFDLLNFSGAVGHVSPSKLNSKLSTSNTASCLDGNAFSVVHADHRTVSLWNLCQGSCDFMHTFENMDWIQELYWHTTRDGNLLLAIQFAYHIVIVGQQRYVMHETLPAWKVQQILPTRRHSNHVIGSLCWLEPYQIALGLGNQILTFDVHVDQPMLDGENMPDPRSTSGTISADQQLQLNNHILPVFSPSIVGDLLSTSQFSLATGIFKALHNELKFLAPNEAVSLDTSSWLSPTSPHSNGLSNGGISAVQQDRETHFDLRELQGLIDEKISRIANWQLSTTDQAGVRSQIRIFIQLLEKQDSLDPNALTYLYHFLVAFSNIDQTAQGLTALPYSAIAHACLSQTQEALLNFVLAHLEEHNIKLTWSTARALGLFLFMSDTEALKVHLETVARNEYNRNQDDRSPVDCSLYYLALDKKAILQSLWRRTIGVKEKESTMKLLANNFKDQKWRATALKNAYALLSRRRFEYAAAFFLLGGSLNDAVNVCVNQLHDFQLAIAITRVWQGDPDVQKEVLDNLLQKTILELAIDTHQTRWMAIWCCVQTQDWERAIQYITQPVDVLFNTQMETRRRSESEEVKKRNIPFEMFSFRTNEPAPLLNLYKQLRSRLVQTDQWTIDTISPAQERDFIMKCVDWYTRAGKHCLALQLVATWEFVQWQDKKPEPAPQAVQDTTITDATDGGVQKSALDDWLEPEIVRQETRSNAAPEQKGDTGKKEPKPKAKSKPPPTQFVEPSADSLLDSFGF